MTCKPVRNKTFQRSLENVLNNYNKDFNKFYNISRKSNEIFFDFVCFKKNTHYVIVS